MIQIINAFRNMNLKRQAIISFAGIAFYLFSSYILEDSYVRSKFPVPYFLQQTSFDALRMKQWYQYMIEQNTFEIYFTTQLIDFVFIVSVIVAGFAIWTFIANCFPKMSAFRSVGMKMAFALPVAGAFDVLENLVSFFMIANPAAFANWLVIPYSTFASLKFAFWTAGLIWMVIAICYLPIARLKTKRDIKTLQPN